MSQPGNFLGSVKMDCKVPENSDAMSFAMDDGHNNFLIDNTIIFGNQTTDTQV